MAVEYELESVRRAIDESQAGWVAEHNDVTRLSAEARPLRLGLVIDEADLTRLREEPRPDLPRIIAERIVRSQVEDRQRWVQDAVRAVVDSSDLRRRFATLAQAASIFPWWLFGVDWRNRFGLNAVTPITNQLGCGSCVAFGTIATMESMLIVERNLMTDLSEAELLFCGGGSCGGWWPTNAVDYLVNRGVAQEACFPYQPMNVPCSPCSRRDNESIKVTSRTIIFDIDQRKDYLFWVGPMVAAFTVYSDFFSYSKGVYSHVSGPPVGGHCVEVIGYNDLDGCWICKNSWGPAWGDGGFFRIAYGQCDIDGGFPFWGISGTEFWK